MRRLATGHGVVIAIYSPHLQVTSSTSNPTLFYVLFFAPVIVPREQLPELLRTISLEMPTTYAADAASASPTNLPGTNLGKAMGSMTPAGPGL